MVSAGITEKVLVYRTAAGHVRGLQRCECVSVCVRLVVALFSCVVPARSDLARSGRRGRSALRRLRTRGGEGAPGVQRLLCFRDPTRNLPYVSWKTSTNHQMATQK
eukprot:1552890-Prymnesium_polylepis.1